MRGAAESQARAAWDLASAERKRAQAENRIADALERIADILASAFRQPDRGEKP